ncbi:UvrD-helicase domain-containing protein [Leptospira sp. GIMC2001]|uniref:UvrD-helicase domain-containing protein n=1 Tax=Leptospira sp. GIMC2001 TaxID=1513297 RepID=UPI00234965A3|nr:UvrD-helicase domain-containing protein [Leptospira sp. GIMC2001]WCL48548.1 UvrD-helicase domain-containing protein [Leptospira sp. GIMC2001]
MTMTREKFQLANSFIEASAGTGKTYTIMEIVGDLITNSENPIALSEIMILTYTEKAAGELKKRLREKILSMNQPDILRDLDQVTIATIHGFCNSILREYPVETETSEDWNLIDIKELCSQYLYKIEVNQWSEWIGSQDLDRMLQESEYWKKDKGRDAILSTASKLLSGKKYSYKLRDWTIGGQAFLQNTALIIAERVYDELNSGSWMSYDFMIQKVKSSLSNSILLKSLQERFRVGIIDEFQDTDSNQFEIFDNLFLGDNLTEKRRALYLIGDPKQSIYGFRGADIATYLRARSKMKELGAVEINLTNNYRSVPEMIEGYNLIFTDQAGETSFFPIHEAGLENDPINYLEVSYPTESGKLKLSDKSIEGPIFLVEMEGKREWKVGEIGDAWQKYIQQEILKITDNQNSIYYFDKIKNQDQKLSYKDIAIIVRSRRDGEYLEGFLKNSGIPCSFYKQEGIYQSKEAEQIENIFRCLLNSNDPASYRKLLISDLFGVSPDALESFDEHSIDSYEKQTLDKWKFLASNRKFPELFRSIEENSKILLSSKQKDLSWERKRTNYRQIFRQLLQYQISHRSGLSELLEELVSLRNYRSDIEEAPLFEKETERDAVLILTLHASKGLEWPVVFLYNLSTFRNSIHNYDYPSIDSQGVRTNDWKIGLWDENIELVKQMDYNEAKRLLYVGITRPMVRLYLPFFMPQSRSKNSPYYQILYPRLKHIIDSGANKQFFTHHHWNPEQWTSQSKKLDGFDNDSTVEPMIFNRRKIKKNIPIYSYSSLKYNDILNIAEDKENSVTLESSFIQRDEKETITSEEADSSLESSLTDGNILPSSADSGSFLHALLEHMNFSDFLPENLKVLSNEEKLNRNYEKYFQYFNIGDQFSKQDSYENLYESCKKYCFELLNHTVTAAIPIRTNGTPNSLDGNLQSIRLAELENDKILRELDFHLFLKDSLIETDHKFTNDRNITNILGDFLKGSIDLVFELEGLYYIADYKSNLLKNYSIEALEAVINDPKTQYNLQRDIYAFALVEYLKSIFGLEEALKKFGGVYYLFLRGMQSGSSEGIYFDFDWNEERIMKIRNEMSQLISRENGVDYES